MPCQTPLPCRNVSTIRENFISGVAGLGVADRKILEGSDGRGNLINQSLGKTHFDKFSNRTVGLIRGVISMKQSQS